MLERHQIRETKLIEQCEIVAALIVSMRPVYNGANERQRGLLETIIGAGIWYIPKPVHAWTGYISRGVLKAFHPDSGIENPRLSEEHVYPRKVAARLLLEDRTLDGQSLAEQFREKYGRVHLITSEENKAVQPFQRIGIFTTPNAAYESAGISLITVSDSNLQQIKKRDRATIEELLNKASI